jgi:hypothetical protein
MPDGGEENQEAGFLAVSRCLREKGPSFWGGQVAVRHLEREIGKSSDRCHTHFTVV